MCTDALAPKTVPDCADFCHSGRLKGEQEASLKTAAYTLFTPWVGDWPKTRRTPYPNTSLKCKHLAISDQRPYIPRWMGTVPALHVLHVSLSTLVPAEPPSPDSLLHKPQGKEVMGDG